MRKRGRRFPRSSLATGGHRCASSPNIPRVAKVYLIDGKRAPRTGEVFKNPALAETYREIAKHGRDAFYTGAIADKLADFSKRNKGLITKRDLANQNSIWTTPLMTSYRGYDVWELPPPGQGIAVLQMLNILEGYDLKKLGFNSPDYWHLFVEAKKLVYADRAKFYADPDFVKVPIAGLISKQYAESRRKLIDMKKAMTNIEPGDPKLGQADTIYLTVVDKDRNCVSLIQSNYMGFGSGLAPADLGFAIQNRGTLFSLDEHHANRLEPGKRPFHTIIPAMLTKNGKPVFTFGVMGGDMQPQGHVEVLVNLLDFGMDVQQAGEAPRIEHIGSATPTGKAQSARRHDSSGNWAASGDCERVDPPWASSEVGETQWRRIPGNLDRPEDRRASRRHGSPQRRGSGGILMKSLKRKRSTPCVAFARASGSSKLQEISILGTRLFIADPGS